MRIIVHKHDADLDVLLLKHKGTTQYSFVNLTRAHICPCRFDSIDEALKDLEARKHDGSICGYEIIEMKHAT